MNKPNPFLCHPAVLGSRNYAICFLSQLFYSQLEIEKYISNQIKFISKSAIIQCFWLHTMHRNMTVWVHKMPLQGRGCLINCTTTTSGDPDRPYGLLGDLTGCTHANQTKVKSEDPKQSALWLRLIWVPITSIQYKAPSAMTLPIFR